MLLIEIAKKNLRFYALILFILFFFLTRIPNIGVDAINPDGYNWHWRAEQFTVGLKARQFARTYQHYHPGVTLMWITGPSVEILKQLTNDSVYNQYTFMAFHITARYALVMVQLVLTVLILFYLSKIVSFWLSFWAVSLFTFEPFFLGNSRLYHMDILFTLLMFLGLILGWIYLQRKSIFYLFSTGLVE
jgi:hypothetical protein